MNNQQAIEFSVPTIRDLVSQSDDHISIAAIDAQLAYNKPVISGLKPN